MNSALLLSPHEEAKELAQELNIKSGIIDKEDIHNQLDNIYNDEKLMFWLEHAPAESNAIIYSGNNTITPRDKVDKLIAAFNDNNIKATKADADPENEFYKWYKNNKLQSKKVKAFYINTDGLRLQDLTTVFEDFLDLKEESADQDLVEKAFIEINKVVSQHFTNAMEEVGEYIIKTFYNNNFDRASKDKPVKGKSLLALKNKFKDEGHSKSWFYYAVGIAADKKKFDEIGYDRYKELNISHRRILTSVKDLEQKKKYVEETLNKNLSVVALENKIREDKPAIQSRPSLINLPDKQSLLNKDAKSLEKMKSTVDKRVLSLENKIQEQNDKLAKYKNSLALLEEALNEKSQ